SRTPRARRREALRHYASSTGDYMPLVEALLRVGVRVASQAHAPEAGAASPGRAAKLDCLRELADLARERLEDPGLGVWCTNVRLRYEPQSLTLRARARALAEPAAEAERVLEGARGEL